MKGEAYYLCDVDKNREHQVYCARASQGEKKKDLKERFFYWVRSYDECLENVGSGNNCKVFFFKKIMLSNHFFAHTLAGRLLSFKDNLTIQAEFFNTEKR